MKGDSWITFRTFVDSCPKQADFCGGVLTGGVNTPRGRVPNVMFLLDGRR